MAQYDNSYNMTITPNKPTLRGIDTNYDNSGQVNQGGIGLGDLYQLDYDRNKIEQIFNQGTDAQYALMQKENQIAQNQYANNQFANQQSALETLRQQRNSQIASGMARGLNAAQEQGTVLGLQQDASAGALELANQQQLQADKIAAEYASNVSKALQEANSVKQAMAQVAAQMYEADMLGYTGELNYAGQMDANASDRYGYDIGYEGTKYTADKNYEGTKYNADKNYEGTKYTADRNYDAAEYTADRNYDGTKYNADKNYEGTKYNADKNYEGTRYNADQNRAAQEYAADRNLEGTKYAADKNLEGQKAQASATRAAAAASASKYSSQLNSQGVDFQGLIDKNTKDGKTDWNAVKGDLIGNNIDAETATQLINETSSTQATSYSVINDYNTWIKALDGNNEALKALGVNIKGGMKGWYSNSSINNMMSYVRQKIQSGELSFASNQELMDAIVNRKINGVQQLTFGF
jgi:hypothetical protein